MLQRARDPRRPARAAAVLLGVALLTAACTASEEAPDDVDATEQADHDDEAEGSGPRAAVVIGAHEYELMNEVTFPVPGSAEDKVRVGLASLVVEGPTTELRLVLTPEFTSKDTGISIYLMFGQNMNPVITDVGALTEYRRLNATGLDFHTDPVGAKTNNGEPILYQAWFPAFEGRPEAVDVMPHPAWPPFEDVPVTYVD